MQSRRLLSAGVAGVVAALLLGGCSPTIDTRGNLPDPDNVLKIQPGIDTKDQVAQLLGTPSAVGTFDDATWYYISTRTRTVAFLPPEVEDQEVLAVKFDKQGVVQDLKVYGVEDGQAIVPSERTTPTLGREMTVLQQLIGNLGRFNKDTNSTSKSIPGLP
jgi:outer membrane protein assembly factor BamE (lipoprotein component of BamABCDE complex)